MSLYRQERVNSERGRAIRRRSGFRQSLMRIAGARIALPAHRTSTSAAPSIANHTDAVPVWGKRARRAVHGGEVNRLRNNLLDRARASCRLRGADEHDRACGLRRRRWGRMRAVVVVTGSAPAEQGTRA